MLSTVSIIIPIFAVIGLGFYLVHSRFIPKDMLPVLSRLVLYCLIPALTFATVSQLDFSQIQAWDFLGVYAAGALLAQIVALIVFRGMLGNNLSTSAIKALGCSMPNSIFIGYPVVVQAFGEEWGHTFAFAVMVENIVILPAVLIMVELGRSKEDQQQALSIITVLAGIIQRLIKNPIIIAIAAGLLVSVAGWSLPNPALRTLTLLGNAAAAIALLVIGGSLVGNTLRGNLRDISLLSTIKLLVHPLAVMLVLMLWPDFDPTLQTLTIVYAALPMAALFPMVGSHYGMRNFCSSGLLVATVASFFTLTTALLLLL
ncbi:MULTISPECIES: AEC family transporter [unclassified Oceanobacter]|jgi:predicted permease|uniref:AEC family transporter n=1 Tax=unclassified Oceanobacter TaxID=2620260 RepID=UPI0026E44FE5|nr:MULTISPECIES: AEC family transporter [unclassified Oceanobacter]MDO6682183.1 AEC family transporter [Oceanobacter sp. 5_MG-2023]MDP2504916.1 AEC family transporter [Oceanobacter sp. 3_MG-2023]MDP2610553.1 AEC family transporter [Oceanobacter sp. 1_MG-2023]MDP2613838.1 AEC family transporter [Oceanobacter sp. 2_MG-2023]